jgi:transposase InsO family protein
MDQRSRFIDAYLSGALTKTEFCARFHISRRVGYKWIARFDAGGRAGLCDQSRAPKHCPHRIADEVAELICTARRQHPDWGPEKSLDWLRPRHAAVDWPAISTAGDLLKRRGLIKPRRPRYKATHPGVVPATTHAPNDLWTADFKGEFRTGDDEYCYPLTVADLHTRYLLGCTGLRSTRTLGARAVFEQLFREYGLPRAIRTDNGVPFATTGLHGLSTLSVWWICLGIHPQRILPAHPQENGAHERMHKTEARGDPAAAGQPGGATAGVQSVPALYNDERPHEALQGATPSSRYRSSLRPYPTVVPAIEYPGPFLVREIMAAGTFRFATSSCSSVMRSNTIPSASRRSPTACGPCTSLTCCSRASTNARAHSSGAKKCYPCSRLTMLPIFPVAQSGMALTGAG